MMVPAPRSPKNRDKFSPKGREGPSCWHFLCFLLVMKDSLTNSYIKNLRRNIERLRFLYKSQLEMGKNLHELRGTRVQLTMLENQFVQAMQQTAGSTGNN